MYARKERNFAEVSKNLARYRSENNFTTVTKMSKIFYSIAHYV